MTNKRKASSTPEVKRVGDWIVNQLLSRTGVEERRSRFADRAALFFRGSEFFHLDEPGLADVRLGRRTIRSRIEELRSDHRIELRAGSSDWIQLRFASQEDAESVITWAQAALDVG